MEIKLEIDVDLNHFICHSINTLFSINYDL